MSTGQKQAVSAKTGTQKTGEEKSLETISLKGKKGVILDEEPEKDHYKIIAQAILSGLIEKMKSGL